MARDSLDVVSVVWSTVVMLTPYQNIQ